MGNTFARVALVIYPAVHPHGRGEHESDLIEDGAADLVAFDKAIFDDVIGDNREWWTFISNAVTSKALERINQKADSKKK